LLKRPARGATWNAGARRVRPSLAGLLRPHGLAGTRSTCARAWCCAGDRPTIASW
jgi:hypothetical protein